MGHATMENLAVAGMVTLATGTAERRASETMLKAKVKKLGRRITDKTSFSRPLFEVIQTVALRPERGSAIESHLAVGHQQVLGDVEIIIGAGIRGERAPGGYFPRDKAFDGSTAKYRNLGPPLPFRSGTAAMHP